jgi:hypothetical protein
VMFMCGSLYLYKQFTHGERIMFNFESICVQVEISRNLFDTFGLRCFQM